jgi:ADP-ribosylglycohydrolase
VEAARANVSLFTRQIIDEALAIAAKHPDIREVREPMRRHFAPTYPYADAVETAAEAIALFWITKGEVAPGIIGSTNLGRDTDCIAGMLGPIAGAFKGIDGVPAEWVETVQQAIDANPYTLQKLSMRELSVRLTEALRSNLKEVRRQLEALEDLDGKTLAPA